MNNCKCLLSSTKSKGGGKTKMEKEYREDEAGECNRNRNGLQAIAVKCFEASIVIFTLSLMLC